MLTPLGCVWLAGSIINFCIMFVVIAATWKGNFDNDDGCEMFGVFLLVVFLWPIVVPYIVWTKWLPQYVESLCANDHRICR